jgi:hypothetical protein
VSSEEAVIGAKAMVADSVADSGWRSEWRGLTSTISGRWGNPEYLALDVLFEDGRTQLLLGTTSWRRSPKALRSEATLMGRWEQSLRGAVPSGRRRACKRIRPSRRW